MSQIGIWHLLANSSLFSKAILLLLLLFSVASWAITLNKHWQLRACLETYMRAINILRPNADLQALYGKIAKEIGGPAGRIFEEGYLTLVAALEAQGKTRHAETAPGSGAHAPERDIHLRLQAALDHEISQLSNGMGFLSTTTAVSPFLGLLGTVWGVMYTFLSIGQTGSAELAVVAPGIAEAMITTIAGLLVAIPALMCNNHLNTRLTKIEDYFSRLQTELDIYFTQSWFREKTKIESRLGYQRDAARRRGAGATDHFHHHFAVPALGRQSGFAARRRAPAAIAARRLGDRRSRGPGVRQRRSGAVVPDRREGSGGVAALTRFARADRGRQQGGIRQHCARDGSHPAGGRRKCRASFGIRSDERCALRLCDNSAVFRTGLLAASRNALPQSHICHCSCGQIGERMDGDKHERTARTHRT